MRNGIVTIALLLGACRAAPPAERVAPVAPAPPPAAEPGSLAERLAREASARTAGAVRVEDLVAALDGRGIAVAKTRQVLAATVGAKYCATAHTRLGLGLAICEFESSADAERGRQRSRQRFARVAADRTLLVNGRTLLTIATHQGAGLDEEARSTAELFAALVPPSTHEATSKGDR